MPLPNPVIVLPGIIANYLQDQYPLPPEHVWTVLNKDYQRSGLHPDDRRYELVEPARVVPGQLYEVVYKELIEELRYNLRETEDLPVPVFAFAYDWRQPLVPTEALLGDFIDEVIARTLLIKHYYDDKWRADPKVNLVGHSMGGLIIAGYLQKTGARSKVGKVVTMGTPFDGSFESVIKITTGTANLGTSPPSSREREAARMTPALYHLLPGDGVGMVFPPDMADASLFSADAWQPTVQQTIAEYVRLHGRDRNDIEGQARRAFEAMLTEARRHRQRIHRLDLGKAGLAAKDWLCVVGVDADTRVRLRVERDAQGQPEFRFATQDRDNAWPAADSMMTGDGTVPLLGAIPRFLPRETIVCVRPDHFGYWEIVDKGLLKVAGFHGMLPAMDMLQRMIVLHFKGLQDTRGSIAGHPLPGVTDGNWDPPVRPAS